MVIKVNKTKDFTVMSNIHLKDKRLSLKAKGLLSIMLSLPDNWDYSLGGLVAICKENKTAVDSALSELKENGYLIITKLMPNETKSGRIEYIYNIYEKSMKKQEVKKQGLENLPLENLPLENQLQYNTNNKTTNKSNTYQYNYDGMFSRFWSAYPRKVSRITAEKSFAKLKPTEELLGIMLTALERAKKSEQWLKDNGQYIPHPATWLNQHRWEDELTGEKPKYSSFDIDDAFENALKRTYG